MILKNEIKFVENLKIKNKTGTFQHELFYDHHRRPNDDEINDKNYAKNEAWKKSKIEINEFKNLKKMNHEDADEKFSKFDYVEKSNNNDKSSQKYNDVSKNDCSQKINQHFQKQLDSNDCFVENDVNYLDCSNNFHNQNHKNCKKSKLHHKNQKVKNLRTIDKNYEKTNKKIIENELEQILIEESMAEFDDKIKQNKCKLQSESKSKGIVKMKQIKEESKEKIKKKMIFADFLNNDLKNFENEQIGNQNCQENSNDKNMINKNQQMQKNKIESQAKIVQNKTKEYKIKNGNVLSSKIREHTDIVLTEIEQIEAKLKHSICKLNANLNVNDKLSEYKYLEQDYSNEKNQKNFKSEQEVQISIDNLNGQITSKNVWNLKKETSENNYQNKKQLQCRITAQKR